MTMRDGDVEAKRKEKVSLCAHEKSAPIHLEKAFLRKLAPKATRRVRAATSLFAISKSRKSHVVVFCSTLPSILSRTHPHPPPNANTMSAFLAGSPVVAKVAAKPVAKRNVTVRAAAPSEYVPRSVPFYLTRRTSNRRDTARRRASRLTSDAPPRFLPPRAFVNSGVTRRAAVAGVLALFVAQPVRALPIIASPEKKKRTPTPPRRRFEDVFLCFL